MHSTSTRATIFGLALLAGMISAGANTYANGMQASYAEIGPETSIPYGWVDFCSRRPEECNVPRLSPQEIKVTSKTWQLLDRINREVNAYIQPISNLEHWGTILDHWDYPVDGKGDCKIYALYKRKLLLDAGLPRQALLMTIVRDLNDEGHTILTVETDHGEFVLDNLSEQVRPWTATGYRFVKRQSQEDPNVWVASTNGNTKLSYAGR